MDGLHPFVSSCPCGHKEESSGSGKCSSPIMPWLKSSVVITHGLPPTPCSYNPQIVHGSVLSANDPESTMSFDFRVTGVTK